jgi:hypothetical protein
MKQGKIPRLNNASLQNSNCQQLLAALAYLREFVVYFSTLPKNKPHLPPFCERSEQKEKRFYLFYV